MRTLTFYGDSDDRREVCNEDMWDERYVDVIKISRTTEKGEEGLYVVYSYSEKVKNGCWCIGFQPLGEDIPIPSWASTVRLSLSPDNGYSTAAAMDVPDDVFLTWYDAHGNPLETTEYERMRRDGVGDE